MKFTLPSLALRRPVTALMLLITILGLGVIAQRRIPLEFLPPLELPFIFVTIPYIGATPEQVQNEVAIPAEGEFRTIANLQRISSTSNQNGCNVRLEFKLGTDMVQSTAEVRDRLERLKLVLPSEIERMLIQKFSSATLPIMVFGVYWEGDEEELAYLARNVIQPRLMRLEGVAECQIMGLPEREILVEFDQQALRNRGLGLYQVVNALRASSLNMSVGALNDGESKYYVRAQDELRTPEELADIIVNEGNVRLREVAKVGFRTRETNQQFGIDGQSGTFLFIQKESMANAIATCDAVKAELDAIIADPTFEGMKTFMIFDQSESIVSALSGLLEAGQSGGLLAVIVLFVFLQRIRPTIVVALAIPSSVLVAFVFMLFTGMTLNLITMISLIIALGMLVDNSIVVIENIYRYNEMGYSPRESAELGANEVSTAITAATATTIVVAVPMIFLETGPMAIYMQQFFAPIIASLIASLVIALTIIPLAASRMKPRHEMRIFKFLLPKKAQAPGVVAGGAKRGKTGGAYLIQLLLDLYVGVLSRFVKNRLASMLFLLIVLLVSIYPMLNLKRQRMPTVDVRRIDIRVSLDQGVDMPRAHEIFDTIVMALDKQRSELCIKNIFVNYSIDGGQVNVYLFDEDELPEGKVAPFTTEQVLDILWQRLAGKVPGGELKFNIADAGEQTSRNITMQIRGDDAAQLDLYAERFGARLMALPDVSDVDTDTVNENQEVRLTINDVMANQFAVSPFTIAQTVDFALRGIQLQDMKYGDKEVTVWAQFSEEDRKSRSNLENIDIGTGTGELVPLNQLVRFGKANSPKAIERVNGKNVKSITAKYSGDDLAGLFKNIQGIRDTFEMKQGYTIDFGTELMELEGSMTTFLLTLLLAVVLIYIVMGALFESYVLPLSILMTVWMAGIGVVWSLYLTDTPIDTISFIGMILLAGIIVNNGIVIIDRINQLRDEATDRHAAMLQAGRDRFRPVMMTALTTILGCVPLAVGGMYGDQVSFSSLGVALIGGLSTGTVLTLFVVPLFYTIIDDVGTWFLKFFANVSGVFGRV